ncbi:hypothetical protein [Algoriphagus sp. oki45]
MNDLDEKAKQELHPHSCTGSKGYKGGVTPVQQSGLRLNQRLI